ncbi:MAG: asparaginase [Bacillota bacterium]|nr:asparaginase [Bacillota bacterium]
MIASVTRGDVIDMTYKGHIAVCDTQGRLLYRHGDSERITFARSSTKPFQAAAAILSGAIDHYGIDQEELALVCGSHSGTESHLRILKCLMAKASLSEDMLQCGAHPPFDDEARKLLTTAPSALHNNCSAKHAGMLLSARYKKEDLSTYMHPSHPHQQRIIKVLAELCDANPEEFHLATDGCGVPVHALKLRKFATAFARLADPGSLRSPLKEALERVSSAMLRYPVMVSGENRLCTRLMQVFGDRLIAKGGANAFYGVGLLREGLGLVIKVESGESSLLPGILLHTLAELHIIKRREMEPFRSMMMEEITNHRGDVVGRTHYHIHLKEYK